MTPRLIPIDLVRRTRRLIMHNRPTASSAAPVRAIAIACGAGIAALLALIVLSSLEMSLGAGLSATVDSMWGVTTMVDLYLGLAAVGAWIGWRERSVPRTIAWCIGLALLGNLITLVYLLQSSLRASSMAQLMAPVRDGKKAS